MYSRPQIVATARQWLGTPYHHQAYLKGVGADCIGLIRGVFVALEGYDPESLPDYSPHWGNADTNERLMKTATKHLVPVEDKVWGLGDVLVFRVKNAKSAKHAAIVTDDNLMIHAISTDAVKETSIGYWADRVVGVFAFPGVV